MNVSLQVRHNPGAQIPRTIQDEIDSHKDVLTGPAGYNVIGPAVLVPDRGEGDRNYPGAYQVWWPIRDDHEHGHETYWAYVDTEGVVVTASSLPEACQMGDDA